MTDETNETPLAYTFEDRMIPLWHYRSWDEVEEAANDLATEHPEAQVLRANPLVREVFGFGPIDGFILSEALPDGSPSHEEVASRILAAVHLDTSA